ncbi:hypothetical protein D3C73_1303230 [compost metagenome]
MDLAAADELQRGRDHRLHVFQVLANTLLDPVIGEHFDAQSQACDGRAQVVGNGGEKARALANVGQQLLLHAVERFGRAPHFPWALE